MALAAYLHVLRAAKIAFRGDGTMLTAAQSEARRKFEEGRQLLGGSQEAQQGIQHAEDVAHVLRMNVVQGRMEDGKSNHYKLNIHEDTERGDNDTVKIGTPSGTRTVKVAGGCG